ncbi:hypothetical protein [Roseateles sp. YR242]|uniref:hypothetical protein n=1 Tax=Roseateles sp. YR242 TaxID=1855305 RepID=UPI0011606F9D|nr:hypothetical protein [Roseateles sp. YR242]
MWINEERGGGGAPASASLIEGDVELADARGAIALLGCRWSMCRPAAASRLAAGAVQGPPLAIAKRLDAASIAMVGLLWSPRPLTVRLRFGSQVQWQLSQAHLLDYAVDVDGNDRHDQPLEHWHIGFRQLRIDHRLADGRTLSTDISPPLIGAASATSAAPDASCQQSLGFPRSFHTPSPCDPDSGWHGPASSH